MTIYSIYANDIISKLSNNLHKCGLLSVNKPSLIDFHTNKLQNTYALMLNGRWKVSNNLYTVAEKYVLYIL